MTERDLFAAVREAVSRFGLSDEELAALCGCSRPVATDLRNARRAPSKPATRAGVERFVRRASIAKDRSSLRLP